MKIHNASTSSIEFSDLKIPTAGAGRSILLAGADAVIYDEDAEKSTQLKNLLASGAITKLSDEEPNDSSDNSDGGMIRQWVLSTDVSLQFTGGIDGLNGPLGVNNYSGPRAGTTVPLVVTNGTGTVDILNSVSTVTLTLAGGTAPKVNGVAGPLLVRLTDGTFSAVISDTAAGVVTIAMSLPTHPSVTLATDSASVTLS